MAEKHIFIGLGGSGVNTVATVKYKIYEKLTATSHKSRLDLLNDDYRFLFVDTDSADILSNNERYRDRYEYGKVDFIDPSNELVNLGDQNPKRIYEESEKGKNIQINKRILEACDEAVASRIPNTSLIHGAGAFRIKSRIAFARKSEEFSRKLRTCITELNSLSGGSALANNYYYWIVSSSNGGTGSGIVNDVLYYVNMLHKQLINPADPEVALVLYMPQLYIDINSTNENYPKNAFAAFSEIEAFQCLSREMKDSFPTDFHRLALIRDYHQFDTNTSYRPFSYCIPVDYQTDKDTNMGSIDNMYYNTAEMLYYIHSGPGGSGFRSVSDNFIYDTQVHSPKSFLVPMGYIALRKPEKDFEDYMLLRMKYELLRYGVIGEKIETPADRKSITDAFYNNVINSALFEGGKSVQDELMSVVNTRLEEDLSVAAIAPDGKVEKELPSGYSPTEAEGLLQELRRIIVRSQEKKDKALKEIEAGLWKWVEDHVMSHGLEYVDMALLALDGKCTEIYNRYTIDQHGQVSERKVLQRDIDESEIELEKLYRAAMEVTIFEKMTGKNREDVFRYVTSLKEFVEKKARLLVKEQVYEILKELCEGDHGIIDVIKRYVANLLSEGYLLLNKDSGAQAAYEKLAKSFLEKGRDVTSVYLPEIQSFVDSYGWKENHKFSNWYSLIIHPTSNYEQGKGFMPVRSGGLGSLEFLMKEIVNVHRALLQEKGYVNGDGNSTFFSNGNPDRIKKSLEDFMYFASVTFEKLYHENTKISDEWLFKPLPSFFNELNRERRAEIRECLDPSLFFTYNQSRESNLETTKNVYVAASRELAEEVLGCKSSDSNSRFVATDNPSVIYMVKAKMGLSFDYYRTYEVIKREYDKTIQKEDFHFHAAFARCNADYRCITLPKEHEPELISFARYMLMDGFKDVLRSYYHSSSNSFDKNNYSNTPFVMEEKRALIAGKHNIMKRGENVCLNIRSGETILFLSCVFGDVENPYKVIYEKFKDNYIKLSMESAIEGLIKDMVWVARGPMEEHFADVRETLIRRLDKGINDIQSREERRMVTDILEVLTIEIDTFDKFQPH